VSSVVRPSVRPATDISIAARSARKSADEATAPILDLSDDATILSPFPYSESNIKVTEEDLDRPELAALCLSRTATVGPGRTSELVSGPPHCPPNVNVARFDLIKNEAFRP
jgi:hypothetical protein